MITRGEDVLVRETLNQRETPIYVTKSIKKDNKTVKVECIRFYDKNAKTDWILP